MSANHSTTTTGAAAGHRVESASDGSTNGPLGPWRLSVSVLAASVTSGPQLVTATTTGSGLDEALGRSLAVATVTWLLLGVIDRILARTTVEDDSTVVRDDDVSPPAT